MIKISISGDGAQELATELKQVYQDREGRGELIISVRKERKQKSILEVDVPLPIEGQ